MNHISILRVYKSLDTVSWPCIMLSLGGLLNQRNKTPKLMAWACDETFIRPEIRASFKLRRCACGGRLL